MQPSTQRFWACTARWPCMPTTAEAPWSSPFVLQWCRTFAGNSSSSTTPQMLGVFVHLRTWAPPCSTGQYVWGDEAGLPLHHYPLEQVAEAHAAVENGAVGKVLVDVG